MTDETENISELILKRINDLRNDNKFTREALLTFGRQIVQFSDRLGGIENAIADMRKDITGVRTDIVLLENKNLDRHSEILEILHRLNE